MNIPTNLPELYAAVVAKRPDLAVDWIADGFEYRIKYQHGQWNKVTRFNQCVAAYHEAEAAALILARWVECLPMGVGLWACGGRTPNEMWNCGRVKEPTATPCRVGPLEALAAFYMEDK